MEELRKRLNDLLYSKRMSILQLAGGKKGAAQVRLNNQINGNTMISAETILLVLTTLPDVSAEWLLRGTGTMTGRADIIVDNTNSHHNNTNTGSGTQTIGDMSAIIEEKERMIKELKEDKVKLLNLLTNLTSK